MSKVIYGVDGNQYTAHREDFTNLAECPCGFGDTVKEALEDLLKQEGLKETCVTPEQLIEEMAKAGVEYYNHKYPHSSKGRFEDLPLSVSDGLRIQAGVLLRSVLQALRDGEVVEKVWVKDSEIYEHPEIRLTSPYQAFLDRGRV